MESLSQLSQYHHNHRSFNLVGSINMDENKSSASPVRAAYKYRPSPSHHKTLSVLGKVKNFATLSIEELKGYCGLVKEDDGCDDLQSALEALTSRFGWRSETREADLSTAWTELNLLESKKSKSSDTIENTDKSTSSKRDAVESSIMNEASIPVILKGNALSKKVLFCEINDAQFGIQGDSGAVGRISATSSSVFIDVKGRKISIKSIAVSRLISLIILRIQCHCKVDSTGVRYGRVPR